MIKINLLILFIVTGLGVHAQYSISGKVTDGSNEPLIGASVVIKNTNLGTVTDINGQYRFDNLNKQDYDLSASFIGFSSVSKIIALNSNSIINFQLVSASFMADEIVVRSTRLGEKTPGASSLVTNEELNQNNLGQDLPYLMSLSPSFVATSDAGAGVGYTGFRIRGSDANRINVTVNGIPMNDSESHGVWWVNMPDFASSIQDVQIQRGVGTSTNGSGAFGASINLQTNSLEQNSYGEVSSAIGSFNTFKNTIKVGSGLIGNHVVFDARLSQISSDGFVDRASSNLKSFFVSGGYYADKTMLKVNVFSGKEKTYQAWWGVPKALLDGNQDEIQRYEDHWLYTPEEMLHMRASDSRTYNYYTYDNETDNYQQDHYHLYLSHKLNSSISFNSALHYTYGRGYYEQYRVNDDLDDYGINDVVLVSDTVSSTNLVRQKWLDNDFYGVIASLNYKNEKLDLTVGGAANMYQGRHFGKVIWGEIIGNVSKDYEYYRNKGEKSDANIYAKANYSLSRILNLYIDLQYRQISHSINGFDDDHRDLLQEHKFDFFNPKIGVFFNINKKQEAFIFYARGHREPNRSNFTDADEGSKPTFESLNDFEAGYSINTSKLMAGTNVYYMIYKDQLILTGEINDVGSAIMKNVDKSYRRGIELFGGMKISKKLTWDVNTTISQNKILDFTEYVDNWDTWMQNEYTYSETDIAFSPSIIANSIFTYIPIKNLKLSINSQYVGQQYIDNSMSNDRSLDAYLVNNLNMSYKIELPNISEVVFTFMVNNLFNEMYETNAWVYSYNLGGNRYAMDGYFPQAGVNFLGGVKVRF